MMIDRRFARWPVRMAGGSMLVVLTLLGATMASAQSTSAISAQVSGMGISSSNLGANSNAGLRFGWEIQARYNPPGKFSVGVGFEQSTVYEAPADAFSARLQSFFVEPRYVVSTLGSSAALYVAARVSTGTLTCVGPATECGGVASETHGGIGGGAGVLVRLGGRVGLDVGAQYYRFFSSSTDGGNTPHFLFFRAGLSYGF